MEPTSIPSGLRAYRIATHDGGELVVFSVPLAAAPADDLLTTAELEVIRSALCGHTNAHVARMRGTSARTVANQMASAFRKLGVGSRGELAARFSRESDGPGAVSSVRGTARARAGV